MSRGWFLCGSRGLSPSLRTAGRRSRGMIVALVKNKYRGKA
jgi:hypothetical protein